MNTLTVRLSSPWALRRFNAVTTGAGSSASGAMTALLLIWKWSRTPLQGAGGCGGMKRFAPAVDAP